MRATQTQDLHVPTCEKCGADSRTKEKINFHDIPQHGKQYLLLMSGLFLKLQKAYYPGGRHFQWTV